MAIYFIQAGENGPIKIGQTNGDVKDRMAQLQIGCPYELKLIWLYTGNDYTESDIHNQLKSEHIRGEWFHPSDTLKDFLGYHMCNNSYIDFINDGSAMIVSETPDNEKLIEYDNIFINIYHNEIVVMQDSSQHIIKRD